MNSTSQEKQPGALMRTESAEACRVFMSAVRQNVDLGGYRPERIYTIARGSSDAAACILWYEFMGRLGIPVTSLPPSAFSLLGGVDMERSMALIISQSGGSEDLVRSARGAAERGGYVAAILNREGSAVEEHANLVVPIGAGTENAVPATKSVVGSVAAGMALLAGLDPEFLPECERAARVFEGFEAADTNVLDRLRPALLRAQHVYVIGRGSGYGAAQEVALKLKETCALHAEAYSASEVLHGPLQLVKRQLLVIVLDTGSPDTQPSLNAAEERFQNAGSTVLRLRAPEFAGPDIVPPAAAALLLTAIYPAILETALALGYDPDAPDTLAKVTSTL